MRKRVHAKFGVRPENALSAVTQLQEHGFSPETIGRCDSGLVVFTFFPLSEEMLGFAAAIPSELVENIEIDSPVGLRSLMVH